MLWWHSQPRPLSPPATTELYYSSSRWNDCTRKLWGLIGNVACSPHLDHLLPSSEMIHRLNAVTRPAYNHSDEHRFSKVFAWFLLLDKLSWSQCYEIGWGGGGDKMFRPWFTACVTACVLYALLAVHLRKSDKGFNISPVKMGGVRLQLKPLMSSSFLVPFPQLLLSPRSGSPSHWRSYSQSIL